MVNLFDISFFKKEELYIKNSTRIAGRLEFQNIDDARAAYMCAKNVFKYSTLKENSAGGVDLFYSNKRNAFLYLIFHTKRVENREIESIKTTGRLLGYPSCCINAYIKDRLYLSNVIGLNWLIRRVEEKNSFPFIINPFNSSIRHIPCNLNCTQTIRDTKIFQKIFFNGIHNKNEHSFITPLPFRISLSDGACIKDFIPISILEVRKNKIQYRINRNSSIPDTMTLFNKGDRLVFENGIIILKHKNRVVERLCLKYFLWSNTVLPEREFYYSLFRSSLYYNLTHISSIYAVPFFVDKRYENLHKKVDIALQRLAGIKNFQCSIPEIVNNMIRFSVNYKLRDFNIILQLNEDVTNYYLKGKHISICIEGEDFSECDSIREYLNQLLTKVESLLPLT